MRGPGQRLAGRRRRGEIKGLGDAVPAFRAVSECTLKVDDGRVGRTQQRRDGFQWCVDAVAQHDVADVAAQHDVAAEHEAQVRAHG
jgi:hypothetical protein